MNCVACLKLIQGNELLKCTGCKNVYHYQCLNITSAYYTSKISDLKKHWKCHNCTNVTRRVKKDDTPVRNVVNAPSDLDMSCDDLPLDSQNLVTPKKTDRMCGQGNTDFVSHAISYEQLSNLLEDKLEIVRSTLISEMKKEFVFAIEGLKIEFSQTTDLLSKQIKDIKEEVSLMKNKVQELEMENSKIQSELRSGKKGDADAELSNLRETVAELKAEINEKEQAGLLNDVDISGIPESEGESLMHIVIAAAAKLGMTLDHKDVVSVSRIGSKRYTLQQGENKLPRPRTITVRLARHDLRKELIKNARVRRNVTTADLGLPQHECKPFYLNERLTKLNRFIFARARMVGRAMNWKFIWTREGKIYAKRSESSPLHLLRSEADIEKVFGKLVEGIITT